MLNKLKVLSFTHYLQGPACSQALADYGADVLKIEATKGAFERGWSGPKSFKNGVSLFFLLGNRNVKSMAVDLKSEEGRQIIYDLVADYDIVVENFRPGVMDKLGFSYNKLSSLNPRVIYCSLTGYGASGPYQKRPGQDLLAQSMSGIMSMTGRGDNPPCPVGTSAIDKHGATLAAFGIVSAAFAREQTGKGCHIDSSLVNAAIDLQIEPLCYYMNAPQTVAPVRPSTGLGTRIHGSPYGVYRTADGYLTLSLNKHENMVKIFEPGALDAFTEDDQIDRRLEYDAVVSQQMLKKTTDEWIALLDANRMWYAKPYTYDEMLADEQVRYNQTVFTMHHPVAGDVRVVNDPLRVDGQPPRLRRMPPRLGEHAREVLLAAGYSEERIMQLKNQGVLNWEE